MRAPARIFLSHSSVDKPFVRRLASELRISGGDIWIDEVEINVGDSLIAKISEGLEASTYLICVLSEASVSSNWVQQELRLFATEQITRSEKKILPVRLDECKIPYFLQDLLYVDFKRKNIDRRQLKKLLSAVGLAIATDSSALQEARWHCYYCGWACPPAQHYNEYLCNDCGAASAPPDPVLYGITIRKCPECPEWNPAYASYCRLCGHGPM